MRSKVLPRKDAIYMVPRSLQKLGGDSLPYAHNVNNVFLNRGLQEEVYMQPLTGYVHSGL